MFKIDLYIQKIMPANSKEDEFMKGFGIFGTDKGKSLLEEIKKNRKWRKTTDEQLHEAREKLAEEYEKRFK